MAKSIAKNNIRKAANTLRMISTMGGPNHPWYDIALTKMARSMVSIYLRGKKKVH